MSRGCVGSGLSDLAFRFAFLTAKAICSAFSNVDFILLDFKELPLGLYVFEAIDDFVSQHFIQVRELAVFTKFPKFNQEVCNRLAMLSCKVEEIRSCQDVVGFSAIGDLLPFYKFSIVVVSALRSSWPKRFLMSLNMSLPTEARRIAFFCFPSVIALALK